jgi:hypothetical protein
MNLKSVLLTVAAIAGFSVCAQAQGPSDDKNARDREQARE